ncbi:MAG: TlpA family protein disulfide reductase, partial [Paludibacteraceae bacterium]|nr:TlpA family protein disulfide reductase [Paludibacteraceae bacterium]
VRLQNELAAYPQEEFDVQIEKGESAMQFMARMEGIRRGYMERLYDRFVFHPNLSQRYADYFAGYYLIGQGESMMQARFSMPGFELPKEYMDYVSNEIWQKRVEPYTLYRDYSTFMRDYLDQINRSRQAPGITEWLLEQEKKGRVSMTPEEKQLAAGYPAKLKRLEEKLEAAKNEDERKALIETFNTSHTVEVINRFIKNNADVVNTFNYEQCMFVIDSVACDKALRSINIARMFYKILEGNHTPLNETELAFVRREIELPAALNTVMELNDRYVALEKSDLAGAASLRPSTDVEGMSDGEAILRKLLEPYKGRLVYIDIWGTWCGACLEGLKESPALKEALKDYDVVYLYLANRSPDNSWKNVIKEFGLTGDNCVHYNLPTDQQSAIEHYLNVTSFPTYAVVDRQGNIHDIDWRDNIDAAKRLFDALSK